MMQLLGGETGMVVERTHNRPRSARKMQGAAERGIVGFRTLGQPQRLPSSEGLSRDIRSGRVCDIRLQIGHPAALAHRRVMR